MLPRGDIITRGHVVARSHDASGNIMGRAHANPIMDTRLYEDNFAGFKVTKLTANSLLSLCTLNAMQMRMSIYS